MISPQTRSSVLVGRGAGVSQLSARAFGLEFTEYRHALHSRTAGRTLDSMHRVGVTQRRPQVRGFESMSGCGLRDRDRSPASWLFKRCCWCFVDSTRKRVHRQASALGRRNEGGREAPRPPRTPQSPGGFRGRSRRQETRPIYSRPPALAKVLNRSSVPLLTRAALPGESGKRDPG